MNNEFAQVPFLRIESGGVFNGNMIPLNASKSETNRALVIQALAQESITLDNLAIARDSQTMQRLLSSPEEKVWDVLDAGTTMRFLTAYLAISTTEKVITGTPRMQERPIKALAEALNTIGANIQYLKNEGYPPLLIKKLTEQKADLIEIPGNISSQYISALLMIAPTLPKGLQIKLEGEIFSKPYIDMTLSLMQQFGVAHAWENGNTIKIAPQKYSAGHYVIESDWSGASYWYSLVALAKEAHVKLLGLRKNSFQGDAAIVSIMSKMGVKTAFENDGITLSKIAPQSSLEIDFRDCPDLAQTVLVVAAATGIRLKMTGLESLRIKETDRIAAMATELAKIHAQLSENGEVWTLTPSTKAWNPSITFHTYEDHRMAMAFAPLAAIKPIIIEEPNVVQKSYPDFWQHFKTIGFRYEALDSPS